MRSDEEPTLFRGLRPLVWRPGDGRLRTAWRIVVPVGVVLAVVFRLSPVVRVLGLPVPVQSLVVHGGTALVAGVLVGGVAWYARRRDLRTYGFRWSSQWWRLFGLGVVVGALGAGGALLTNLAFGWASVAAVVETGSDDLGFLLLFVASALTWLCVGFWEELVFRGLLIRETVEGLTHTGVSTGRAIAGGWFLSAVLFGVVHLNQAPSWRALHFWILGGFVFGLVYVLTGELAMPIGLHFGFDIGATNLFGLTAARQTGYVAPTLLQPSFTGPELLVGLSGVVNTVWLVFIGAASVGIIHWQLEGLRPLLGE